MPKQNETSYKISGMHCAGCVASIEKSIQAIDGVDDCRVNLATSSATVAYNENQDVSSQIITTIQGLGYEAEIGRPDILIENIKSAQKARTDFTNSLGLTVPLMIIAMWPMLFGGQMISPLFDYIIQAILAITVLLGPGRIIVKDALLQTRHFRANMNSLISLGTLAALGWSIFLLIKLIISAESEAPYFDSVGMIITLILLGRFLEARSKGKAGQEIRSLMNLRPRKAVAVINGVEIEIDPATARPGMIILIKPGERVASDGEIIEGEAVIDESMLTGESLPVEKSVGDKVIGGSLNGNHSFKIKVTSSGKDSFLNQIIDLVMDAQSRKAPVQHLADRVAGIFVPVVLGLAFVTLVCWYLLSGETEMILRHVIAVLIIACPCALGLATPTAILVGTGRAAREGIIIRGGDIIEKATKVDTVVFDKTGTLTSGNLEVVAIHTFGRLSERNLLRIVGSAEAQSEHPIGEAIYKHMRSEQIESATVRKLEAKPGFGLVAECDGRQLVIGNRSLMDAEKANFGQSILVSDKEMSKGRTTVYAAMDHEVVGIISLSDRPRSDAKEIITQLKGRMKHLDMLSGDTHATAGAIAKSVGLENFQAEVKPDQKKFIVDSYCQAGYQVAMVGDGINDAPALAAADIGIAIGSGTDIAMETADVVLVNSELSGLVRLFDLSKATMKIIRQNLFWAFFYNIIAIPIAAGALYPAFGLSLSPVVAAAAMALSSVFVVSNSLRLNRLKLRPDSV